MMIVDKIKLTKKYDRRRHLTDEERIDIKEMHRNNIPIRAIARKYQDKCSRRLIQFILFPERDKKLKEITKKEKRWLKYYNKGKHTKSIRNLRKYKQKLLKEGKIN